MIALCAAFLASTFSFSGSKLPELAAAIAKDRKQAAAFLVSGSQNTRRFQFAWSTPEEFNLQIVRALNLQAHAAQTAYWPAAWPDNMVDPKARSYLFGPRAMDWPIDGQMFLPKVAQGVYCRLGDLNDLADMGGLPIRVHWFLENAVVAFAAEGKVYDALPAIAAAAGGLLTRTDVLTSIDPDPPTYRSRLIAALQRRESLENQKGNASPGIYMDEEELEEHYRNVNEARYEARSIRTAIVALEQATDAQIRDALDSTDPARELAVVAERGSKLWRTLDRQMLLYGSPYLPSDPEAAQAARRRLEFIDCAKPVEVLIRLKRGDSSIRFWSLTGEGQERL